MRPVPPGIDPHLRLRPRPPCFSRLSCDLQALHLPELHVGLVGGLAGLLAGVLVGLAWRQRPGAPGPGAPGPGELRPPGSAGLLATGAGLGAFWETGHVPAGLALALALLVVGGLVADANRWGLAARAALAAPGAASLAGLAALPDPGWALVLVALVTVVGGCLVVDMDRHWAAHGAGPVLLALTVVGIYETVPDPDLVLALLGVVVPMAALGWPLRLASLGSGSVAFVGLLAWATAVGGRGRLSSVVGGLACLGLLVVEPLARALGGRHPRPGRPAYGLPRSWSSSALLAGGQLAVVYVASRVAGLRRDVGSAVAIVAIELMVATGLAVMRARFRGRADGDGAGGGSDRGNGGLSDRSCPGPAGRGPGLAGSTRWAGGRLLARRRRAGTSASRWLRG